MEKGNELYFCGNRLRHRGIEVWGDRHNENKKWIGENRKEQ
jgi:hypothetical protein